MRMYLFCLLVICLMIGCETQKAQESPDSQRVGLGAGVTLTANVVSIDRVDRSLGLLNPKGRFLSLDVDEAAHNFDQIEIGDELKVVYYESVTLFIGKDGAKPSAIKGMVAARAQKGDMPAGVVVEAVDVTAKVKAIDKATRTVTLSLPDAKELVTKVDPSVKAYDTLEVGDTIHARYTEAFAISVERP